MPVEYLHPLVRDCQMFAQELWLEESWKISPTDHSRLGPTTKVHPGSCQQGCGMPRLPQNRQRRRLGWQQPFAAVCESISLDERNTMHIRQACGCVPARYQSAKTTLCMAATLGGRVAKCSRTEDCTTNKVTSILRVSSRLCRHPCMCTRHRTRLKS